VEVNMTSALVEIEAMIRSLSADDRATLIATLIADLDAPADADVASAWIEEARRRHGELVDGKTQPVPAERAFERLRSRLGR
jgi:putative addiction module component (TIGR02574 family)